jgi:sulfur relay (sulfurtransferase) complex TusBCD TusD component (DsrE family)
MASSTQRYGGITLKKTMFSGLSTFFGLLFAVLAMTSSTVALAGSPNCNGGPNGSQNIVVHLKRNLEDLQAAIIATRLGSLMAEEGCNVTLFLTLRGVRLADARMPQNLEFGRDDVSPAPNLEQAVLSFQGNGGTVAVCPACAGEIGLTPGDLIPGATILDRAGLVDLFLTADKILDF